MKNKIWCLFSIANEYDQPDNNLEAWWIDKPKLKTLKEVLVEPGFKESKHKTAIGILKGLERRLGYLNYRLRQVQEGKLND